LRLTTIKDKEKKYSDTNSERISWKRISWKERSTIAAEIPSGLKNIFRMFFPIKNLNFIRYLRGGLMQISLIKNKKVIQHG